MPSHDKPSERQLVLNEAYLTPIKCQTHRGQSCGGVGNFNTTFEARSKLHVRWNRTKLAWLYSSFQHTDRTTGFVSHCGYVPLRSMFFQSLCIQICMTCLRVCIALTKPPHAPNVFELSQCVLLTKLSELLHAFLSLFADRLLHSENTAAQHKSNFTSHNHVFLLLKTKRKYCRPQTIVSVYVHGNSALSEILNSRDDVRDDYKFVILRKANYLRNCKVCSCCAWKAHHVN